MIGRKVNKIYKIFLPNGYISIITIYPINIYVRIDNYYIFV